MDINQIPLNALPNWEDKYECFKNRCGTCDMSFTENEHNLTTPNIQRKDDFTRIICHTCRIIYKRHKENNQLFIDNDEMSIEIYLGVINPKFPHCTSTYAGLASITQFWYHCEDCYPNENGEGSCLACVETCHKDHKLSKLRYGAFHCHCATMKHHVKKLR